MGFPAFAFESLPPLATTNHSNAFVLAGRCGGGAIRTLDALRHAAFPRRCTRPLCDASVHGQYSRFLSVLNQTAWYTRAIYRHMTHVSKHKIDAATKKKIVASFMDALFITNAARGKARVYALLTSTE